MNKIFALVSVCVAMQAHATPQGYAGRWELKVIQPVVTTTEKPIFYQSGHFALEMISSVPTFWSNQLGVDASSAERVSCEPEFLGGAHFQPSTDEDMSQFTKQAGGIEKVDKILKKNLGTSFSRFDLVWGIGPGDSGKEPCKSIGDTTFYLTKDKKHVLVFKYPYIYRFDGGYGRIGSK